ncbi:helix-turn-helix domain-containing protein [Micromonospora sp. NBC_01655]|uniref:helix-turn-helix domain-containing protein n=1 Tax=Micromonospora sp. NBC_01655 TaxID=2975983 RepID=UPI002258F4E4|nr:helix-turn-helix domain-containing protein [Micromonospora sp. NBC_01655]MCX4473278.1 helix-turn-helix domain-containing protein [Micromonospora sp. NBC_01655]
MDSDDLPIGRRVAQWRARRRMTQQMLADRLGKSKSWVDKVERGVRALDRFSVIQDIAEVLRVDPSALVGGDALPSSTTVAVEGVDGVRAALARYPTLLDGPGSRPVLPVGELGRRVEHAWLTYQHAHYPQVVRMLPDLLGDAQRAHAASLGGEVANLLVQVYRIVASTLVKLEDADLAWLAADRAMAVAAGDPLLEAIAAIPLGQALRTARRGRLAMAATVAAAHRIAPPVPHDGPLRELSWCGTLLVEAALAAAVCGDGRSVGELIEQAAEFAEQVGEGQDHHHGASFGPTTVELARVAAAVELGDGGEAVSWHEKATGRGGWGRLPVEHRAAHLVDAARAYLQVGDLLRAGRALVDAGRTAPAEIRCRPVARTVIADVARGGPTPADVARLAALVGLTR